MCIMQGKYLCMKCSVQLSVLKAVCTFVYIMSAQTAPVYMSVILYLNRCADMFYNCVILYTIMNKCPHPPNLQKRDR